MPHDANNDVLQVGDRVLIHAVIVELNAGEDFCNVTLETERGRRPDGAKERVYAINTGVLVKNA